MTNNETGKPIANRVKEFRDKRRWSQDRLAREASTTARTIHNIERGKNDALGATKLRLAEALGIDVDILFPLESSDEETSQPAAA